MWYIHSIDRCYFPEKHLLPSAEFILVQGKEKISVKGWLPCHQTNIAYHLEIRNGRITRVHDLQIDKSIQNRNKAMLQVTRRKKKKDEEDAEQYKALAMASYSSVALWTCTVLYTHWELRHMNTERVFALLSSDIEVIIEPESKASRPRFLFQPIAKTRVFVQRALRQMGEMPYDDWEGFEERRAWHLEMTNNTGVRKKPSTHIRRLEHYQDLWTTSYLIEEARVLRAAYRPDNVTLIEGSPCPMNIPQDARVVFKNLEDVYKWKCEVDYGQLFVMTLAFTSDRRKELGVADVAELLQNQSVYVPWAHTWGQREWLELSTYKPTHVTAMGRIDLWPSGRDQLFRDMLTSKKFDASRGYHAATDHVVHVQTTDIATFVAEIVAKHKVVQCFSEASRDDIDTGRRWLTKPKRIRTLRDARTSTLYEEAKIQYSDRDTGNASVVRPRQYSGLKVPAGIYLCTENTKSFDIHVARAFSRDILYIVNCNTCLFSMQKQAPTKCTINPFV